MSFKIIGKRIFFNMFVFTLIFFLVWSFNIGLRGLVGLRGFVGVVSMSLLLIDLFFDFIFLNWVCWELNFIIIFQFFFYGIFLVLWPRLTLVFVFYFFFILSSILFFNIEIVRIWASTFSFLFLQAFSFYESSWSPFLFNSVHLTSLSFLII